MSIGPRSVATDAERSHYLFREPRASIVEALDRGSGGEDRRAQCSRSKVKNHALGEDETTDKPFQIPFVVILTAEIRNYAVNINIENFLLIQSFNSLPSLCISYLELFHIDTSNGRILSPKSISTAMKTQQNQTSTEFPVFHSILPQASSLALSTLTILIFYNHRDRTSSVLLSHDVPRQP